VQAGVATQMHLREVFKLRRKRGQGNGDEEEEVRDCEEEPSEKESPSSNTGETSDDSEFVPHSDELQSNGSIRSCTSDGVTCSDEENPEACALAVHASAEEAAADLENHTAKEVIHSCLLIVVL
jgi:hypothetical protein